MNLHDKKRILHIAHGLPSYNNSLVEMITRLSTTELDISVASHVDLGPIMHSTGVDFYHLNEDLERKDAMHTEMAAASALSYGKRQIYKLRLLRQYRIKSLHRRELKALLEEQKPDLLLIDMECHVAILHAIKYRIPTVLCSRWFTVFYSSGLPPLHTKLTPASNSLTHVKIQCAWISLWLSKFLQSTKFRLSIRRFVPVAYHSNSALDLTQIATELNIDFAQHTDRFHWLIPHVYRSLPVMSLTAQELEFENSRDSRMHYVGAMVGATNIRQGAYQESMNKLSTFLRGDQAAGRHLIYCAFSTFWLTDAVRIKPIIELFSNRPDLVLVAGMGGKATLDQFSVIPDNILLLEFAPQIDVIARSSLVITHGGISTINEALSFGVPMIVYSSGHVDQDGCMARLVHHNLALEIKSDPVDPEELGNCIDDLLSQRDSNSIKMNTARLQKTFAEYKTGRVMESYLNSLIQEN